MSHVIIGNSTAAIAAIEGIRKHDKHSPITIISDEVHHTYSRPLISYYLGKKVDHDNIFYRDPDFYKQYGVDALLGTRADSVDFMAKKVKLQSGAEVDYSKLLIATGSKPFIPHINGLGKKNIFNFLKLDDVIEIDKVIQTGSRGVVIGASFSGLKAVEALVYRGVHTTVIDVMSRVMPRLLDEEAASVADGTLNKYGVNVILNNSVEEILGDDAVNGVRLKDGREIPCDFVILAIGVRCNTDIVKDSSLNINRGIVVDCRMQTNIPDVYAAGDVAEAYSCIYGNTTEIPIIPNAYFQGETAGANMAGANKSFDQGIIMNSMPLFDLSVISAGVSTEGNNTEVIKIFDREAGSYKKFYIEDDILKGFLLLKDVDRAGIYTYLIRNRVNISTFKDYLPEKDFGFIYFPKDKRKECMLNGGAHENN